MGENEIITLLLNRNVSLFQNSVGPDQLASYEAS